MKTYTNDDLDRARGDTDTPEYKAAYERARLATVLGDAVRAARTAAGISQAELARRMNTTQPVVARLEGGGSSPTFETLDRVANALGLKLVVSFDDGTKKRATKARKKMPARKAAATKVMHRKATPVKKKAKQLA